MCLCEEWDGEPWLIHKDLNIDAAMFAAACVVLDCPALDSSILSPGVRGERAIL